MGDPVKVPDILDQLRDLEDQARTEDPHLAECCQLAVQEIARLRSDKRELLWHLELISENVQEAMETASPPGAAPSEDGN